MIFSIKTIKHKKYIITNINLLKVGGLSLKMPQTKCLSLFTNYNIFLKCKKKKPNFNFEYIFWSKTV